MPEHGASLLDHEDPQLLLPDVLPLAEARVPEDPRNPAYTADRYHRQHPAEYALIAQWCCSDLLPVATVADALGCSRNLVSAIVRREQSSASVEHLKQSAAAEYRHVARLSRETLCQVILALPAPDKLTATQQIALLRVLPIAAAVSTDKAELLSGGVTSRIAVEDGVTPGAAAEFVLQLQAEVRRREAMGVEGDAGGQREIAADDVEVGPARGSEGAGPAGPGPVDGPGSPDSDGQHMDDVLCDGGVAGDSGESGGCDASCAAPGGVSTGAAGAPGGAGVGEVGSGPEGGGGGLDSAGGGVEEVA